MERSTKRRSGVAMAWVGIALLVVSSGTVAAAGEHSRPATSVDRSAGRSLEQVIAAGMEGVQLDVWEGGAPSPGRTTTLFVHHGDRAAMLYWTTDGWCLARVYSWSVERAVSVSDFEVRYVPQQEFGDCVMAGDAVDVLKVVDVAHTARGDSVLASWNAATWTVRTTCPGAWNGPTPCGFAGVAALVPDL